MEIVIKDAAIERDLADIVSAYHDLCPAAAASLESVAAEESKIAVAHTTSGAVNSVCKIPSVLFSFIRLHMARAHSIPHFFSNSDDYRLFLRAWKTAAVRPR